MELLHLPGPPRYADPSYVLLHISRSPLIAALWLIILQLFYWRHFSLLRYQIKGGQTNSPVLQASQLDLVHVMEGAEYIITQIVLFSAEKHHSGCALKVVHICRACLPRLWLQPGRLWCSVRPPLGKQRCDPQVCTQQSCRNSPPPSRADRVCTANIHIVNWWHLMVAGVPGW